MTSIVPAKLELHQLTRVESSLNYLDPSKAEVTDTYLTTQEALGSLRNNYPHCQMRVYSGPEGDWIRLQTEKHLHRVFIRL